MKRMKQILALLLAALMILPILASCSHKDEEKSGEITATPVKYSKSGVYTTTVSSESVDLSGITADNVEVRYLDPDFVPEDTSSEYVEEVTEEETTEAATDAADEKVNPEEIYTLSAKVESVKAAGKKKYEITFTDDKSAEFLTRNYIILFKSVKGDYNTASVAVEFPAITLTSDIENVVSDATQAKVTLTIDGSTFEDGISEKDIYLDNAFSDMKIESVSSSDKNLTVLLKGTPTKNAAGAYQWGSVNVKPSGIKDGYATVTSKIDIQLSGAYMDAATLKYENGKINAALKILGVVDIDTLTKDHITIEGATVEEARKTDANTVMLTIAVDGVKSVNDFADAIGENAMKLGDYETRVSVSQTTFYPVFDYVEEVGDNLKLTLKFYSFYGEFDKDLKTSQFSFSDGFKDAKAESVKVDKDGIVTLIISVPANGQKSESLDINGTVKVAADALVNVWGEKASKDASYTRHYSNDSMGKDDDGGVTLNNKTLLEIQKFTRGKNTTFGAICYWAGVGGQVFSIAKSVLEMTGVLKSEHEQLMDRFNELSNKIDGVLANQIKIMDTLDKFGKEQKSISLDDYKDKIDTLNNYVKIMEDQLKVGALYMALSEAKDRGEIDDIPNFAGLEGDALTAEVKKYEKYIPDINSMNEQETYEYSDKLVNFIIEQSKDQRIRRFASFKTNFDSMYDALFKVTDKIKRTDGSNPFTRYDELCAMTYNFDSQCYYFRASQRDVALALMGRAMAVISIVEKGFSDPLNPNFKNAKEAVTNATKRIEDEFIDNLGHAPEDMRAFPNKERAKTGNSFISDLAVSGDPDKEKAKKALTDRGYTVIEKDLNSNAGGHFIYLGYKTTTDYTKAIQRIILRSSLEKAEALKNFTPIKAYGESSFVNSKGDLNHQANGTYIYLGADNSGWWIEGDKGAISEIYFNSDKNGSVQGLDLNFMAGGDDIFLHTKFEYAEVLTGKSFDTDPEYYPYSYVLGKKVSIRTREQAGLDNDNMASIKNALKNPDGTYRAWTSEESNDFVKRMGENTLEQEFKNAGINGAAVNLALEMELYYGLVKGKYIPLNSNTIQTTSNSFDSYGAIYNGDQNKTNTDNFTFMSLYDYSYNKVKAEDVPKNSPLVEYTSISPNRTSPRTAKIDTIIINVKMGNWSLEDMARDYKTTLTSSANYGIDSNGKIGMFVEEADAAKFSGPYNDRAISIIIASGDTYPYKVTSQAYDSLVNLLVDVCSRNGIKKLVWDTNKDNRLNLSKGANFLNGRDYAYRTYGMNGETFDKMGEIARRVNEILGSN